MRPNTLLAFAGAVALVAAATGPVLARQHDMNMGTSMAYDKATEKTITGTIDNIVDVPGTQTMSGPHLVLNTKDGVVHVHAGPAAFLASKKIAFKKGDQVEVVGSLVKGEGFEAILARRIKRGGQVVTLRNDAGMPLWAPNHSGS
jgi:hypothetical protein